MVLNRSLSLNAAGGTLRPLARLTHKELETLYHELFHAYMDFLEQESAPPEAHALLMVFAREQQRVPVSAGAHHAGASKERIERRAVS